MSLITRRADLCTDRVALIEGLREHLNPLTDDSRFDWLYVDNPDGPAHVWVIEEEDSKTIVGSCAALPRRFLVGGREVLGCVIADTWVHPDHRVLGPAVKLQRAVMKGLTQSGFALGYDFPRQSMIAVYRRLRVEPVGELLSLARLLRLDSFLANRLGASPPVRWMAGVGNTLLRMRLRGARPAGVTFELDSQDCSDEYTELQRSAFDEGVSVVRSADYLNWRYRRHFHRAHEFLVARRRGELIGYLVFIDDPYRTIGVDMVCRSEPGLAEQLIRQWLALLCGRRCESASLSALDGGPSSVRLENMGFRRMESVPFVVLPGSENGLPTQPRFEFTIGDEAD